MHRGDLTLKTSRPGVCNAAETLLVHEAIAPALLSALPAALPDVELRADERARAYLPNATPASEDDFRREFLDLILAVKVVSSLDEAIEHAAMADRTGAVMRAVRDWVDQIVPLGAI